MNILGFLLDSNNDPSSKRIIAFLSFIVAVVIAFVKSDPVLVGVFLGTTATILGFQAVTRT